MLSLQRVIAFIRTMMGGATPTPPAGPAPQEPTQPSGKVSSASATKRQSKPVAQKPKRKPKVAPSTKVASSPKPKRKPARKTSGASGKQPATRASKTRQHAK